VSIVCCQVEVSAMGRSFVQGNPTECDVSECDLETSTMSRARTTTAVEPWKKCKILFSRRVQCRISYCYWHIRTDLTLSWLHRRNVTPKKLRPLVSDMDLWKVIFRGAVNPEVRDHTMSRSELNSSVEGSR
jgi:hypothetical protein